MAKVKGKLHKFYCIRNLEAKTSYQNVPISLPSGQVNQQRCVAHHWERMLTTVGREEAFSGNWKLLCSQAVKGYSRKRLEKWASS